MHGSRNNLPPTYGLRKEDDFELSSVHCNPLVLYARNNPDSPLFLKNEKSKTWSSLISLIRETLSVIKDKTNVRI